MARKNPAAVALGKLGGVKGGPARMDAMTTKEREEFARKGGHAGSTARWDAYYKAHPEKWIERQKREAKQGTVPRGRPKKKTGKKAR